jgi:hypothetical protein
MKLGASAGTTGAWQGVPHYGRKKQKTLSRTGVCGRSAVVCGDRINRSNQTRDFQRVPITIEVGGANIALVFQLLTSRGASSSPLLDVIHNLTNEMFIRIDSVRPQGKLGEVRVPGVVPCLGSKKVLQYNLGPQRL